MRCVLSHCSPLDKPLKAFHHALKRILKGILAYIYKANRITAHGKKFSYAMAHFACSHYCYLFDLHLYHWVAFFTTETSFCERNTSPETLSFPIKNALTASVLPVITSLRTCSSAEITVSAFCAFP